MTYRVGHTTIAWTPYFEPDKAVRELAAFGFPAIETFGVVLEQYERDRGGFQRVLDRNGVNLNSAYLFSTLLDPARAGQDIADNLRWARLARELGADAVVVGADDRERDSYGMDDYRVLADSLNSIGEGCLGLGIPACFHPHTGTPVETREEIEMIMELTDPSLVFFAPDTGQLAKGGNDPVEVVGTYLSRVRHVHLKDYIGGTVTYEGGKEVDRSGFLNYVPLGSGVVDIPAILGLLDKAEFEGWVNIELDANEDAPAPPEDAVLKSKEYLEQLMGRSI